MQVVYQSEYSIIYYDADKRMLKTVRNKKTEHYTEATYRTDIEAWRKTFEIHKVPYQLVDERNMLFSIAPHLQTWVNGYLIAPAIQLGLKRVAFLVSHDLFAQVGIEQTMEEKESKPLQIAYFENEADALAWLLR